MEMKTTTILPDQEMPQQAAPVPIPKIEGATLRAQETLSGQSNGKNAKNGSNGNAKLEALIERQKEIEARLAAEKIRLLKRKQKDDRKLFAWVGREVCEAAEKSPEFRLMIAQTLGGAVTDEAARRFLEGRGYIA